VLQVFSGSTAPWLGTGSRTDVAFFNARSWTPLSSGAGCTGTPFVECNFTYVPMSCVRGQLKGINQLSHVSVVQR
jgi:hypothetical protein